MQSLRTLAICFSLLGTVSLVGKTPRIVEKHKADAIKLFQFYIQSEKWNDLAKDVARGLQKKAVSIQDLEKLASENPSSLFATALTSAKRLATVKTGLKEHDLIPIAILAESTIASKPEKQFWASKEFGTELQYDPETNSFFIHLKQKLGEGRKKIVTKTLRYDRENPELFARGTTTFNIKDEMEAMRALKGLPCLLEAKALMTHKDPKSHKKISTIVTPIYSGALQDIFDKKIKLSFKQKLKIAHDIMQGIAVMQAKGYVHRDLGARNYFYLATLSKKKITDISAIVADMGRTIPASDAAKKPVQGNSSYIAPEGFFRSKMKGKHYYQSDLFAVGCVFWELYFGKPAAWRKERAYKKEELPLKERFKLHLSLIQKERAAVLKNLPKPSKFGTKEHFIALILKMTDPDPKKRCTAKEALAKIESLMHA